MNLDRLPVLAASAANAITAVGARFQKLDRRVKLLALAAAGATLLTVGLAASGKSGGSQSPAAGLSYLEADGVNLGVFPPQGFKGTMHTECSARFENGLGGFDIELNAETLTVSAGKDQATFKSEIATESKFWGTAYPNPDADHSKNRLCIQTVDRCGKVLSSEGEDPDGYSGAIYPDRSVKVGETWTVKLSGTGTNAGSTSTNVCILKEVVTIKGRPMAVITYTERAKDMRSQGTRWFDMQTGIITKDIGTGSGETPDGWPTTVTVKCWFTDASGNRWVD